MEYAENTTIGTSIAQLQCTDGDLGANSELVYSIAEGDSNGYFAISSDVGEITTVKALDYETIQSYSLTVEARDNSSSVQSQRTAVSHVDVIVGALNEHAPSFSQASFNVTLSEKKPLGTTVVDIDATDLDQGPQGEVTFLMSSGSPFYIDSATGLVTLKQALDYEMVTSYILTVTATDKDANSPKSTSVNVTVNVRDENDNAPTFTPTVYSVTVAEDTAITTIVLNLTCADADSGSNGQFNMAITAGTT